MPAALIAPVAVLFVAAVVAAPSVWLAGRRGRSMVIWGALGLLFPISSIVFLALLGRKKGSAVR